MRSWPGCDERVRVPETEACPLVPAGIVVPAALAPWVLDVLTAHRVTESFDKWPDAALSLYRQTGRAAKALEVADRVRRRHADDDEGSPGSPKGSHEVRPDIVTAVTYIDTTEASTELGTTPQHVTRLARSGQLAGAVKRSTGWRVPRSAIDARKARNAHHD